jgi:hypothetical protein
MEIIISLHVFSDKPCGQTPPGGRGAGVGTGGVGFGDGVGLKLPVTGYLVIPKPL